MKSNRIAFLIVLWVLLFVVAGFMVLLIGRENYSMLNLSLVGLILIFGSVFFLKKIRTVRELSEGLPEEDELSNAIKYKTGYRAYMASMYVWLIIFLLRGQFLNIETALGSGILISALIFGILKRTEKNRFFEKQD